MISLPDPQMTHHAHILVFFQIEEFKIAFEAFDEDGMVLFIALQHHLIYVFFFNLWHMR